MESGDFDKKWYTSSWRNKPPYAPSSWEKENISNHTRRQYASATVKSDGQYPTPYEAYTIVNKGGSYKFETGSDVTTMEPYYDNSFSAWDHFPGLQGGGSSYPKSMVLFNTDHMGHLATECYSRVSENNMNLGAELAELDETVHYVATTLEKVCEAILSVALLDYKGLSKKAIKRAKRRLPSVATARKALGRKTYNLLVGQYGSVKARKMASLWLEYRYAISPMMFSAQDAIEVYNSGLTINAEPSFEVKATRSFSDPYTKEHDTYGWRKDTFIGKYTWRMKLRVKIKDPVLHVREGFDLNQGTMIIERIPYSFVWEWAVDTSALITAVTARNNTEFQYGYVSVRGNLKRHSQVNTTYETSSRFSNMNYYRRWVLTRAPIPTLEIVNPLVDHEGRYKFGRMLDALSLLLTGGSGLPKVAN